MSKFGDIVFFGVIIVLILCIIIGDTIIFIKGYEIPFGWEEKCLGYVTYDCAYYYCATIEVGCFAVPYSFTYDELDAFFLERNCTGGDVPSVYNWGAFETSCGANTLDCVKVNRCVEWGLRRR